VHYYLASMEEGGWAYVHLTEFWTWSPCQVNGDQAARMQSAAVININVAMTIRAGITGVSKICEP
jgi:hypothetical protein